MFCLKPFKKWSDLVRKDCFSYQSAYLDSSDKVFKGIPILRYIKDPGASNMKKQEEIPFQEFIQRPSFVYFVQGKMHFIKINKNFEFRPGRFKQIVPRSQCSRALCDNVSKGSWISK